MRRIAGMALALALTTMAGGAEETGQAVTIGGAAAGPSAAVEAAPAPEAEAGGAGVDYGAGDPNYWRLPAEGVPGSSPLPAPSTSGEMVRMAAALASVMGVILLAVWGFRKFAPRTASMFSSQHLKVLARTHIGPRQSLYLVRTPASILVLGATQENINLLAEIRDPSEVEKTLADVEASSSKSATNAFRSLLSGGGASKDDRGERDLAAAVSDVSARFASLNRRLSDMGKEKD